MRIKQWLKAIGLFILIAPLLMLKSGLIIGPIFCFCLAYVLWDAFIKKHEEEDISDDTIL